MALQRTPREYFRQNTSITNPDGSVTPGDRFLSKDVPTAETFKRFSESLANILEVDDAAKTTEQGLVKLVSGSNAKSGTSPDDGFSYAAQIKNLPQAVELTQTIGSLISTALVSVKAKASEAEKNVYEIGLSSDFINWLSDSLSTLDSDLSSLESQVSVLESQVGDLSSDVIVIQGQIDDLNSDILSIQSDISTIQSDLTSLDSRVSQNEADIAQLQLDVAAINPADNRFLGEVVQLTSNTPPSASWILMDGAAISRTTYSDYFALVGTTYGVGNGSTTFNIPDMGGKGSRGYISGDPNFDIGTNGGSDSSTLVADNIPEHDHPINLNPTVDIETFDTGGTSVGTAQAGDNASSSVDNTITVNVLGNSGLNSTPTDPFDVRNPYQTLFFFVKIAN